MKDKYLWAITQVIEYTVEELRELIKSGGESIRFDFARPIIVGKDDTLVVTLEFTIE